MPDINKIVFAPFLFHPQGGVLDLANSKIEPFVVRGEGVYDGAVLAKNGKVVFVPSGGAIGIFDPVTNAHFSQTIEPYFSKAIDLFRGGVPVPDGRIVFVPQNSKFVGIFDPESRNFEVVPHDFGSNYAFSGGMWVNTLRKVLFVPYKADRVGFFDPESMEVSSAVLTECPDPDVAKYWGGLLLPDGRAVFTPRDANNIGVFDTDPAANDFRLFDLIRYKDLPATMHTDTKFGFSGGVLLPDGRVVLVPSEADSVAIFTPGNKTA